MTIAKAGAGSKLFMSSTGATGSFVPVAQLKTFAPKGSKQTIVDQTNISTPDNFSRKMAVRIDSGELNLDGVLDPANTSILQLGTAHASMALYFFWAVLSDGTQYTFQGLVSEYVPFSVSYSKAMLFSATITISGALTGPAGAA
jgi:hypothetical protein